MQKNHAERFENMSTEELEQLLCSDISAYPERALDDDEALAVLDILEQRKLADGSFTPRTDEMWTDFRENWLPTLDEAAEQPETAEPIAPTAPKKAKRFNFPMLMRVAGILLVLLIVGAGATVTGSALGFDIWKAIAEWTSEQFTFSSDETLAPLTDPPEFIDEDFACIEDALAAHGLDEKVVPTWLPEDWEMVEMHSNGWESRIFFDEFYTHPDFETFLHVGVTYHIYNTGDFGWYEKDDDPMEVYVREDIDHYIFSNIDMTQVVWFNGRYECSVSGPFDYETAKQIVDSVYD